MPSLDSPFLSSGRESTKPGLWSQDFINRFPPYCCFWPFENTCLYCACKPHRLLQNALCFSHKLPGMFWASWIPQGLGAFAHVLPHVWASSSRSLFHFFTWWIPTFPVALKSSLFSFEKTSWHFLSRARHFLLSCSFPHLIRSCVTWFLWPWTGLWVPWWTVSILLIFVDLSLSLHPSLWSPMLLPGKVQVLLLLFWAK